MIQDRKSIPRPTREAADWFARLSHPVVETEDLEAFSAWRRDPANRAAYEHVEDISRRVTALQGDPDIRLATAEALSRGAERRSRLRAGGRAPYLLASALVAASIVAAVSVWAVLKPTYATGVGQTFSTQLADGSRLTLDTDSQVRIRYSKGVRRIELLRGQALFEVSHDTARPFIVAAGQTQVRATGTRFEVRRIGQDVRVTLTQGSVEVTDAGARVKPWRLAPGQRLALAPSTAAAAKPTPVDVRTATSWTTGALTFEDLPLEQAVAEVNRYSRDKIILGAGAPGGQRINGVFPAGDNDDFIAAVASFYRLEAVRRPDGDIELRPVTEPKA